MAAYKINIYKNTDLAESNDNDQMHKQNKKITLDIKHITNPE